MLPNRRFPFRCIFKLRQGYVVGTWNRPYGLPQRIRTLINRSVVYCPIPLDEREIIGPHASHRPVHFDLVVQMILVEQAYLFQSFAIRQ